MLLSSAVCWTVFAVSCLVVVAQGQDARCMENLFNDVADCFSQEGLDLSARTGQQDAATLMRETQTMDPATQCSNLEAYKKSINCSLTTIRQCLNNLDMGGSIPDPKNFQKGIEIVCQRQDEFDSDCLKNHYQHILTCGEETVKRVVSQQDENKLLTMDEIICLSSDVNYDCSRKHLQSCKNNTLEIYLEQLNKYQVPSACVNRPPGRPGRQSNVKMTDSESAASGDNAGPGGTASAAVGGGLAAVLSLALHLLLLL